MSAWIVVGGTNLGESDRVIRFLSPTEGRVALVARAARASRRRFAGLLELGNRLTVQRQRGRGSLQRLVSVDRVSTPSLARTELERIALLAYGCELCAALAPEGGPAPRLHRLLEVWLDVLEGATPPGVSSRLALEAKALTFAGLAPALVLCARTGAPLPPRAGFDPSAGGAVASGGKAVPASELVTLEGLRRTPLSETPTQRPPGASVHWVLADFIEYQLGRPLRSRPLLTDLAGGMSVAGIGRTEEA